MLVTPLGYLPKISSNQECIHLFLDPVRSEKAAQQVMFLQPVCPQQLVNPLRHLKEMSTSTPLLLGTLVPRISQIRILPAWWTRQLYFQVPREQQTHQTYQTYHIFADKPFSFHQQTEAPNHTRFSDSFAVLRTMMLGSHSHSLEASDMPVQSSNKGYLQQIMPPALVPTEGCIHPGWSPNRYLHVTV